MDDLNLQQIGPYRIEEEIGRGSVAIVYRASDALYERQVALKVLPAYFAHDPKFVRRFISAGRDAARLRHPNIVQVYDAGQADGSNYIAMELVAGGTLGDLMQRRGRPLPLDDALSILEQAAAGLDYAHARGHLHRDLRPSNVLLAEDGRVLLSDFAPLEAADARRQPVAPTGYPVASPAFLSPEQARGSAQLDERSDIYGLGVLAYAMLTGSLPFDAENPLVLLRQITEDSPPLPESLNPQLTPQTANALTRTLAKDPTQRYKSAGEFVRALAGDEPPVVASPVKQEVVAGQAAVSSAALVGTVKPLPPPVLKSGAAPASAAAARRRDRRWISALLAGAGLIIVLATVMLLVRSINTLLERTINLQATPVGQVVVADVVTFTPRPAPTATPTSAATPTRGEATATGQSKSQPAGSASGKTSRATTPDVVDTASDSDGAGNGAVVSAQSQSATPPVAVLLPTSTATSVPTPTPTTAPSPTATPSPTTTPTPSPSPTPAQPGVVYDFEEWTDWPRGDETWGALTQSDEQVVAGSFAGKVDYDFPADAPGGRNYVVFHRTLPITSATPDRDPNALKLWVYGDGSNSFVNAWVQDAAGQLWQFTFGQVAHSGWAQMSAPFNPARGWPNQPIGGDSQAVTVTYPVTLNAIVVDGYPENVGHKGAIYFDDLSAMTLADMAMEIQPALAVSGTAAISLTAVLTPTVTPAPLPGGRLAYAMWNPLTNRMDLYVYEMVSGSISLIAPNRRQPDFDSANLLAANSEGGGIENLVRMGPGGEGPIVISEHPEDTRPHWSPSGEQLVFDSSFAGDRNHRVYLQDDAKVRHDVPPLTWEAWEIFGRYPIFLADGRIAYNGCNNWENGSICGLQVFDPSGAKPATATDFPGDIPTDNLGSQVLFMSEREGNWDVFVVNPDGSGLQRLTDDPARDGLATVSPDGRYIAFVSDRGGSWSVYFMRTDGSDERKLFDLNGGYGEGEYDWVQERLSWGW